MEKAMLSVKNLYHTEPVLSIGIILPIDKKNSIEIFSHEKNKLYKIETHKNKIIINNSQKESILLHNDKTNVFHTIRSVPAGRGFHWEKSIDVKLPGSLLIKNKNGFLFIINKISLEEYLPCVATSEMSGACPPAFLEAQTITARSWIIAASEKKHSNLGIDACNDDCCQRYQGIGNITTEAITASKKTRGKFLVYKNEICDARYSKSCGGITENNENVWEDPPKPYLRGIFDGLSKSIPDFKDHKDKIDWILNQSDCYCSNKFIKEEDLKKYIGNVDNKGTYYRWVYSSTQKQLTETINKKCGTSFHSIKSLIPKKRGISGRITSLEISGLFNNQIESIKLESEYEIRNALHPEFLYSSAFVIILDSKENDMFKSITLKGAGWGHGVGLCQIGALGMALSKKTSKTILSHYFSSALVKKLYD